MKFGDIELHLSICFPMLEDPMASGNDEEQDDALDKTGTGSEAWSSKLRTC